MKTKTIKPLLHLTLTSIIVSVFGKSLFFRVVHFDDSSYINLFNSYPRGIQGLFFCFKDSFGGLFYRPMLGMSFFADSSIGEASPIVFHFTNILLHVIAVNILFHLLVKLTTSIQPSFLLSALFAIHPINTQAVVWIPGRNDSLLFIFTLLSFLFFIRVFYDRHKIISVLMHQLFFFFALFTKETAFVIPLIFLVFYLICIRTSLSSDLKFPWSGLVGGWVLLVFVFFIFKNFSNLDTDRPLIIGLSAICDNYPTVFALLGKVFLPLKLNGIAVFESVSISAGIIIFVILLSFSLLKKKFITPLFVFGLLWFIVFLTPSMLVRIPQTIFGYLEHRAYLPFFGLLISLSELATYYKNILNQKFQMVFLIIIILLLSIRTLVYQNQFTNKWTFWKKALDDQPETGIIIPQEINISE